MDDIKKQLIDILKQDARKDIKEIAVMLNIDEETVKKNIKELESDKVILRYKAVIDPDKVDDHVEAIIEVRVTPEKDHGFDKVAERIANFPEVRNLFLLSGDYDFLALVRGKTLKEVAFFVASKLSPVPGVKSTATRFMLKRYKEDNVMFAEKEKSKRLSVTP